MKKAPKATKYAIFLNKSLFNLKIIANFETDNNITPPPKRRTLTLELKNLIS